MKIQKTKKLYYRSFPYKATFRKIDWIIAGLRFKPSDIRKIKKGQIGDWGMINRAAHLYPDKVCALIEYFEKFNREDIRIRYEWTASIFFKDRKIIDEINALNLDSGSIIETLWEPADEASLEFLLSNERVEIKKDLTHGCRYTVFLKNFDKFLPDARLKFYNLAKTHPENIILTDSMKKGLKRPSPYYWGVQYFYVKDSKFLLMVQMILQPFIREVVKTMTYNEIEENVQSS
jgi:hypothetical protein